MLGGLFAHNDEPLPASFLVPIPHRPTATSRRCSSRAATATFTSPLSHHQHRYRILGLPFVNARVFRGIAAVHRLVTRLGLPEQVNQGLTL